jgi:hypothetical protein
MANNAEVSDQVANEYVAPSMLNDTSDSTARFGEKGGTASTYLIARLDGECSCSGNPALWVKLIGEEVGCCTSDCTLDREPVTETT